MASNFKRVGNWAAAKKLSNDLKLDINHAAGIALRRVGLETERKVVKYIQKQPGVWPALSEEYIERKKREGYSQLMLRRTGDYINRITSQVQPDKMSVFVGVRKGVRNKEGNKLWQIGAVMEYGRKGEEKKARPHFRPVMKLMRKKIVEKDLFGRSVYEYIKKKHSL